MTAECELWRGRKRRAQEAGAAFQCLLPGQISSRLVPGAHTRTHTHTGSCIPTWKYTQSCAPMCIHTNTAAYKSTQEKNTGRNTAKHGLC